MDAEEGKKMYFLFNLIICVQLISIASGISCLQCNSQNKDVDCERGDVEPTPCVGLLNESIYCVKRVSKHIGGTNGFLWRSCTEVYKQNCSIHYTNNQKWETCVYTCSTDGCNAGDRSADLWTAKFTRRWAGQRAGRLVMYGPLLIITFMVLIVKEFT